jgi:hypothetical protein
MNGLITNEWDRDNLEFLLNTKGEDFEAFWAQADEDDRVYAQELLDAYSLELKVRAEELRIEAELALNNNHEANQVIQRFRLTGS